MRERSGTWVRGGAAGGWRLLLASAVVVAAVGCGAKGSGAGAGDASGDWCEAATRLFLHPADPAVDAPGPPKTPDEAAELLERARTGASDDHIRTLIDGVRSVAKLDRGDYAAHADEIDAMTESLPELIRWANDGCEPEWPAWGCATQSKFEPVGDRISADGETTTLAQGGPTPAADPSDEEIGGGPEGTTRTELTSEPDEKLYAWVDDHGLVQTTRVVRAGDGEWVKGASAACRD